MVVLGLVCLADNISFKTITLKKYNSLSEAQKIAAIEKIYLSNITILDKAIQYCYDNQIMMYRMSSNMFPLSDYCPIAYKIFNKFEAELLTVGNKANALKVRLLQHPSQFVVLNSDNPEVIEKSIHNLRLHALLMNYLNQPVSRKALLNIHGGKRDNLELLVKTINNLDSDIKDRLTLENDEDYFDVIDLYYVYEQTGVPIVFDFHHYLVNSKCISYNADTMKAAYKLASSTWEDKSIVTTHISNGANSFYDRKHSDYITNYPYYLDTVPYVEVESKAKNLAIDKLVALMR